MLPMILSWLCAPAAAVARKHHHRHESPSSESSRDDRQSSRHLKGMAERRAAARKRRLEEAHASLSEDRVARNRRERRERLAAERDADDSSGSEHSRRHHRHMADADADAQDDTPRHRHRREADSDSEDVGRRRHDRDADRDASDSPTTTHHRHRSHPISAADLAAHLQRLAREEKAAWRLHLAKVRALPRAARLALVRHNRRLREIATREARLSQSRPHRLAKLASATATGRPRDVLHAAHDLNRGTPKHRLAHPSPTSTASAPTPHARRLARLQAAHEARLREHLARLARLEAAHEARLRAHEARLAESALRRSALLARQISEHNAQLAAQESHYVAMHGDDSSGRVIRFWQTEAAHIPVKVITVDLNDSNVKVSAVMARHGNGTAEPFRQMIQRTAPNVAVTGTFFSLDNLRPIGDIVIDGSLVHFGGMGTALCVTPNNQAKMVTCDWGHHHDWSDYDFVCACGPRLLQNRRVVLDPPAERFKDRHMLSPNSRIAVGITPGNKLVFAMTRQPIYLGKLAKVMLSLGCSEAMNLDAGASTGFYFNGTTLAQPGRWLTNMIVVYARKDRYEHALGQLFPPPYHEHSIREAHPAGRAISAVPGSTAPPPQPVSPPGNGNVEKSQSQPAAPTPPAGKLAEDVHQPS